MESEGRYIDFETMELDRLARVWKRMQRERKALGQMGAPDEIVDGFVKMEKRTSELLTRALRKHPLWPWLAQFPGLGGAHTAAIIGLIGDPRRFPGQLCSEGHYLPAIYEPGTACPVVESGPDGEGGYGDGADDDPGVDDLPHENETICVCPGLLREPRATTGVRSLWRYLGLDADDEGRAPRHRKGVQSSYSPRGRSSVMQPGGIAEQIVRQGVPVYVERYRDVKARLLLRVSEQLSESGKRNGDPSCAAAVPPARGALHGGGVERPSDQPSVIDAEPGRPLRLFEADRIARKIAAKDFVADLLIEWKDIAEGVSGGRMGTGSAQVSRALEGGGVRVC